MIVAVVPAKDLSGAKLRLASLLSLEERRALFTAMLADVLAAAGSAASIDRTLVVARQPELMELARELGAEVCEEPANLGHTEAVRFATTNLIARGVDTMLTIPGDVPAVTSFELDAMVAALPEGRSAVLVPSRSGLGTNGALLRPPDAMPLRFGEPSFPNHRQAAERAGLPTRVVTLPGLGLDIDTPADLAALASTSTCGARTRRLLEKTRFGDRARAAEEIRAS